MQWTIDQIVREAGNLELQITSYLERCRGVETPYRAKIKRLRKWIKAQTNVVATILFELLDTCPEINAQVEHEQQNWPNVQRSPADIRVTIGANGRPVLKSCS